ncbi:hypothetical protein Bhyg_08019 [Pseudolycoriella hygida]|uniref:MD-2-related lipid-recognition domain-containing protein n=1 Tax=Pseudolycoriella hygida TaxID=35572 RepID=A0A9Q0S3X6_9DIPT|nr:hypothetical protein Bhyg_08019 [Pseudolycoriella hygida]
MFATLVFLVLSVAVAFGGEENVAYFDNFQCTFNNDFCGKTNCILTPHNDKQTEQTSTVSCELKKSVDDVRFRVIIFAKELQANLVDMEEDFCGFMSGKDDAKVLAVLMPFVKKHSNINHPCPYSGLIQISEMPLGSHLLESHDIPAGDYILNIQMISGGATAFNTTSMLHIPEGKAVKATGK